MILIALWYILYTFWAGEFSENGFNSMLNLGPSLLRVVMAYKIYREFVPWQIFWNEYLCYLTLYFDLCILLTSLSDGVIFLHYDSCRVYKIIGDVSPISNTV